MSQRCDYKNTARSGRFVRFALLCSVAFSAVYTFPLRIGWAQAPASADAPPALEDLYRLGQPVVIGGQTLYIEKIAGGKLVLAPPEPRTEKLGAFITPVAATASSFQEGRTASKMIDGSGWGETWHGSGVYVHVSNVFAGGSNMWNGAGNTPVSWVQFDLGKSFRVSGVYVWNYNEGNGYANRSVKDVAILASTDGTNFAPVGTYTLDAAPGADDYRGQTIAFKTPVAARYFKFDIKSNYRGSDVSGIAEVRFAHADVKAVSSALWKPTYPRPTHLHLALGAPLSNAENMVYPADMGIVDVTKAPYLAKGDGHADDTAAIQRALNDHPRQGAIIYLPNGIYRVSRQLRWPIVGSDDNTISQTVLQGQSKAGTVLQLIDACPRFDNPRTPRGVIWTGHAPAQRFGNEVCNLTIDTGINNPGACGLQFIANNQGGVYDVAIVSGDGQGVIGLDLSYTDEEGPLLIKNVSVQGFDVGIATATSVDSETMEHVALRQQNVCGFRNDGQAVSVRDLRSSNHVPAVKNSAGLVTLIDCIFTGTNGADTAIRNDAGFLARNVQTPGYATALVDHGAKQTLPSKIAEFQTPASKTLLYTSTETLGLPIRETPTLPWDAPKGWVSPQSMDPKAGTGGDDSAAIQKAIDSGATTVYLPRGTYRIGQTIVIRGNVRRIVGGKAYLEIIAPLNALNAPVFRFDEGAAPVVIVERMSTDFSHGPFYFLENAARQRTLVLRALSINFQGPDAYRNSGGGPLFLEDVVGQAFVFNHQSVWARQFNTEANYHAGPHALNDGGTVWILGIKTEGGGTQFETRNGGSTEILGGFIGDTNSGKLAPMFVNTDSRVSALVAEVCFDNDPFDKIVQETRSGQTKMWTINDTLSGLRTILYEGHDGAK